MTPKEKAKELYDKMDVVHYMKLHSKPKHKGLPISMYQNQIKQCALTCVDEILKIYQLDSYSFWKEVKQEIKKL